MYADRVKQSVTSPGSGTVTLPGAASTGYQTFLNAFGSGSTLVSYCIADQAGNSWEVGTGTYNGTANTLTRSSVFASSNSNSLVNFASGVQDVFCTAPARYLDVFTATNQGTVPASGGGNSFLRSDGVWAYPSTNMGMDGADGEDGIPGPAGVAGSAGATGATGVAGSVGMPGEDGIDGDIGPPGTRGATGLTGAVGPIGMMGEDGVDGDAGPPGLAGSTGQTGDAGMRGQIGPAGEDGSDAESFLIGIPTLQAAGSNTQIQYNNAGAFGGSANFTYDVTNRSLAIGPAAAANATLTTVTPTGSQSATLLRFLGQPGTTSNGGGFSFVAGASGSGGAGGTFTATGGTSTTGSGGGFTFTGGATTATTGLTGGSFTVNTGAANGASGTGGNVIFGLATGASTGGRFQVTSGSGTVATNGAGGAVNLTAGNGVGTGVGGALNLTAGNAVNGVAGAMTFNAGDSTNSTGGALTFNAGDSTSGGVGGSLVFQGGNGVPGGGGMTFTSGFGGSMSFTAGETTGGPYNAGGLTFAAGSYTGGTSTQNGGNLTFTSGSSNTGLAGEFACLTGFGLTSSGDVRLETGFVSGGGSGDIIFITGVSGLSVPAVAGNLVYTGGTSGFDDDDVSGTGGGLVFTGGYGFGSAGVGGSFTFTAGGGNATQGSINLATVSGTSIQLADNGTRQLGFFGAAPVAQPTTSTTAATFVANSGTTINSASTFDGYTLAKVVKALRNLGILA